MFKNLLEKLDMRGKKEGLNMLSRDMEEIKGI